MLTVRKPVGTVVRARTLRLFLLASMPLWLLTFPACGPGRLSGGIIGDPCFNGSYELTDAIRTISVTVVHNRGTISLSGFNTLPTATVPWELLSFSGNIDSPGSASGSVTVWFPRSDGLPISRDGIGEAAVLLPGPATDCTTRNSLTLSFRYPDPSGATFTEMHTLTRR